MIEFVNIYFFSIEMLINIPRPELRETIDG